MHRYNIRAIWSILSRHTKLLYTKVIVLNVITTALEIFIISSVVPFAVALLSKNNVVIDNPLVRIDFLDNIKILSLVILMTILISTILKSVLLKLSISVAFKTGTEIAEVVFKSILFWNYDKHKRYNSSYFISLVDNKIGSLISYVDAYLKIISSIIIIISLVTILGIINNTVTFFSIIFFGTVYIILRLVTLKRLHNASLILSNVHNLGIQAIQETIHDIRSVKINNNQELCSSRYVKLNNKYRHAQGEYIYLGQAPKIYLDGLSLMFIGSLAYISTYIDNNDNYYLSTIAAIAIGAQRLLPICQQLYASFTIINADMHSVNEVTKELKYINKRKYSQPDIKIEQNLIKFSKNIKLENISFNYKSSKPLLESINLTINYGEIIYILGESGSGKSTLMDIILGLLSPSGGTIYIDNEKVNLINNLNWYNQISIVNQTIYLPDKSIAEIITDSTNLTILEISNLSKLLINLCLDNFSNENIFNNVGENGNKLSGGEKQRILIAKAIYKRSKIIFLDEATSALDDITEEKIMNYISMLKITVVIITHKESKIKNLENCYRLKNGRLLKM